MSTKFSIGQMNQLGDALELAGFTPDDVTKLRSYPQLKDLRMLVKGYAQLTVISQIIDLDASPYVYVANQWDTYQVKEGDQLPNRVGGQWEWDPEKVQLYYSQSNRTIGGYKLREELQSQLVYGGNLLDWLLIYPELIPDSWKGQHIHFWGTIYRSDGDSLYIRYLYLDHKSWKWGWHCINSGFDSNHPAAVAGSKQLS